MNATAAVFSIAGAVTIGAMSPGPSFLLVARTAVSASRADGFATALGMGVGGVIFAVAALLGLHMVLDSAPWLHLLILALGGGYLVYLGCRIWLAASRPLIVAESEGSPSAQRLKRSFVLGLFTQLSNPKAVAAYAGIFTALLPRHMPRSAMLVLPVLIFAIETGWYAIVALALSSAAPRSAYLRTKVWIDRTAGGVMVLLGVKLIAALYPV